MAGMKLLDGKIVADRIKESLKDIVATAKEGGINPKLCVIQIGENPASSTYVKNKERACKELGIECETYNLPNTVSSIVLADLIYNLNHDGSVHGILLQMPLPKHLDEQYFTSLISSEKDVDGFHPENAGMMFQGYGEDAIVSCTPKGIMDILDYYDIDVAGKECVVIGRSNIVGKPIAMLLLQADGTVTICHSKTKNLKEICKRADLLVCCVGKPKFFNEEYVKEGAVVIDVGINRDENGKLCGDVDFDRVKEIASAITPVPGGVGPMTVIELMSNVVELAWNKA